MVHKKLETVRTTVYADKPVVRPSRRTIREKSIKKFALAYMLSICYNISELRLRFYWLQGKTRCIPANAVRINNEAFLFSQKKGGRKTMSTYDERVAELRAQAKELGLPDDYLDRRPLVKVEDINALPGGPTGPEWLKARKEGPAVTIEQRCAITGEDPDLLAIFADPGEKTPLPVAIGGSEIGAIAGHNAYDGILDVWLQKTGRSGPKVWSPEQQVMLEHGHMMEPIIMKHVEDTLHWRVFEDRRMLSREDYPFMSGDCDGMAETQDGEPVILEFKTPGSNTDPQTGKPKWIDGIHGQDGKCGDNSYLDQVRWYMAAMNGYEINGVWKPITRAVITACFRDHYDYVMVEVQRDLYAEQALLAQGREFAKAVILDIQPSVAQLPDTRFEKITKALPLPEKGTTVTLPDHLADQAQELLDLEDQIKELNDSVKELQKMKNALMADILPSMGTASMGTIELPDGSGYVVTNTAVSRAGSYDEKAWKIADPEGYEEAQQYRSPGTFDSKAWAKADPEGYEKAQRYRKPGSDSTRRTIKRVKNIKDAV